MEKYNEYRPGILVSIVLAGVSVSIEKQYPILWSVAVAFILGFTLNNIYKVEESWVPGLQICGKSLFKYGFAVIGFGLKFSQIMAINIQTIELALVMAILIIQVEKIKQTDLKLFPAVKQNVVMFIGIFLIGLCINSLALIPEEVMYFARVLAKWLFAIAAVGMGVNLSVKEDIK
ncbi:Conserved hypothetical protein 698 [Granulicatella balaenopterae]|uniref:Sulfate exporter family transporter n=1 Tax=Granulicatella balaenopterae TaxID=137733 RepID=A0A1H9JRJ0_9LACT|nr:putative sulfate exporter family transporter [Granulicatella balaenopterae]SEQ89466.1 Conserved hypothetical protein 698 [Granulicatella balaenopterae]